MSSFYANGKRASFITLLHLFIIAVGSVNQGDLIWLTWKMKDLQESFTLCKVQDNIIPTTTQLSPAQCCHPDANFTQAVNRAGIFSRLMTNLGVETFKSSLVENEKPLLWCCIIAQPVAKVSCCPNYLIYPSSQPK